MRRWHEDFCALDGERDADLGSVPGHCCYYDRLGDNSARAGEDEGLASFVREVRMTIPASSVMCEINGLGIARLRSS